MLVTEISHDKQHYVGHNKFYEQVLVPLDSKYMGKLVKVKIVKDGKFSMVGEPVSGVVAPGLSQPLEKGQVSGLQLSNNRIVSSKVPIALLLLAISVLLRIIWMVI